jgi:hypothetical protein
MCGGPATGPNSTVSGNLLVAPRVSRSYRRTRHPRAEASAGSELDATTA